jgi:hypothetical protein
MSDGKIMTKDEIYKAFDSEWVLVNNPELNEFSEFLRGRVIFHSKDRDAVHAEVRKLPVPRWFAVFYTGKPPEDVEYAL